MATPQAVSGVSESPLWASRNFVLLWIGQAVSVFGDFFGTAAQSVLVYELTGSKVAMGTLWLAYLLPMVAVRLVSVHCSIVGSGDGF